MTLTPSSMLALGTKAPDFELSDVTSGKIYSLENFENKKVLLAMFICRHCPYVEHVQREIAKIGKDYTNRELAIVAIGSNDPEAYPEDAPENLAKQAKEQGFVFPYLFDEEQKAAKAYTATCTPDFFLFNNQRKLVYRGQMDDSRPGNGKPVTGKDLRGAIAKTLENKPVSKDQKPSTGCNIKWKEKNILNYFA